MFQAHSQKRISGIFLQRAEGLHAFDDLRVVAADALVELEEHQVPDHHSPPAASQVMKSPIAFAASEMPWNPMVT